MHRKSLEAAQQLQETEGDHEHTGDEREDVSLRGQEQPSQQSQQQQQQRQQQQHQRHQETISEHLRQQHQEAFQEHRQQQLSLDHRTSQSYRESHQLQDQDSQPDPGNHERTRESDQFARDELDDSVRFPRERRAFAAQKVSYKKLINILNQEIFKRKKKP